jgi:hypothetical protein
MPIVIPWPGRAAGRGRGRPPYIKWARPRIKFEGTTVDYPGEEIVVDIVRVFIGELLGIAAYALLGAAVYKLFQISTVLAEIKELLQGQRRGEPVAHEAAPGAAVTGNLVASHESSDDAASEYARNLLRSLNAESKRAESEPREVA